MPFTEHLVSTGAAYGPLLYVSLFFATFIHEGTAIATGAAFLVARQSSMVLTAAALIAGIVAGDLGVYGLGALARRSEWLRRRLDVAARRQPRPLFGNRLIPTIAMCRVVPGLLFPTFLSYGWCGIPFRRFAVSTILVTMVYVPLLLTLFVQFGLQMRQLIQHWPWSIPVGAILIAATVLGGRRLWTHYRDRNPARQSLPAN